MKKIKFIFVLFLCVFSLCACDKKIDKKDETKDIDFEIIVNEYIGIGNTYDIKAIDANGNDLNVTWTVDDEAVANIEDNKITGISEGIVTITATYNNSQKEAYAVVSQSKKIEYKLDGGTCEDLPEEIFYSINYALPTPKKDGYVFLGWYSNPSFSGSKVTELNSKNFSITTLYASWHTENFQITYVLTNDTETIETYEGSAFTSDYLLNTPVYDSETQVFSGWYLEEKLLESVDVIKAGTAKDVAVYGVLKSKDSNVEITYVAEKATYESGSNKETLKIGSISAVTPIRENYTFIGWYRDSKYTYPANEGIYKNCTLYGKFKETYPVNEIKITNTETEIFRKGTLQLTYTFNPSIVSNDGVTFESSNTQIASVSSTGLITGLKAGEVTITIKSKSESGVSVTIVMQICDNEYFNVSYDTNSYVLVGEEIKLNAKYNTRTNKEALLTWKSLNEDIASVNEGVVKGIKAGYANIRVALASDASKYFDFGVTVYDSSASDAYKYILNANNSNVFTRYNLGIGAGSPVYYTDIIGSVSKLLYNYKYEVNTEFEAVQANISYNHGETKPSTEFIVVHYTGNMASGADAHANASYFANGGGGTSIHYVTGNDGIYHCLDDSLIGFHAGDGHGEETQCEWYATGIMYKNTDSIYPTWGISKNSKYTLNGQETKVDVPTGETPQTTKVTDSKWINKQGLAYKIIDGEYYLGKTWWCYKQVSEGRLCNKGGNMNSVGIESCVNKGSDLWKTWQITAELVARLMVKFNLPINRVMGHHFFSAKDCPQPMLENNLEIWWEFLSLVEAEYERITTYDGYTFTMEVINGNSDAFGRVTQDNEFNLITYKVTITSKTGQKEEVTLSSIIEGSWAN